jgi:hypothetical protein
MARSKRQWFVGLFVASVFAIVLMIVGPGRHAQPLLQADQPAPKERPVSAPVAMPTNLVGLEIRLGLSDTKPTAWDGEIQLSEGRVSEIKVAGGGPKPSVDGPRFKTRSIEVPSSPKPYMARPSLQIMLDAPGTATLTLKTEQGTVTARLADLVPGVQTRFLNDRITIERQDGAVRLTGPETEDDFPALAKGPDGYVWLAYVEYQPGPAVLTERLYNGEFDALVPRGHGDCIRLRKFDGTTWQAAIDVTERGLDVWRPTIAVDGKGDVWVAWSQQVNNDWEIFHRRYTPGTGWSKTVRVTESPGTDFNVVATTDSTGTVWLAWQSWQRGNFDIMLMALADDHPWKEPRPISQSTANDWNPAIAADTKGNVYVAWDTYDKGNYDVRLFKTSKAEPAGKTITVADSARFEARASLACDAKDRVWIAYEEGDEQWGKDYSTSQFRKIGFARNPGAALYLRRTIRVKCLVDDQLYVPEGDLERACVGKLNRSKSLPRLVVDKAGGIWILFRHHPTFDGEVWNSYALRYDGKTWSAPRRLGKSANLLDNRPAVVPLGDGVLTVYSGDDRTATRTRGQDDLFATTLSALGRTVNMELNHDEPAADAKLAAVHPSEAADTARIRAYRIGVDGKQLRLLRGEFHRHTEYTAHVDADGTLEDAWRYALDAGDLDWIGIGDHTNGYGSEYMWWHFQKYTDFFHHPPRFVGAYVYERSVEYPNGHRNVILPKRGIRPLPLRTLGPNTLKVAEGTPEQGSADSKMLFAYLKHFNGICASHTSGTNMGTDWRDNDPVLEPIVEIYQGHRHNYEHKGAPRAPTAETQIGGYRPAGYVWNALEKGYRFGFQASSDHISTHLSYAVVLTDDASRQGIIDAFKKRHCYGATDNIIVDVRSQDGHIMGDAFETTKRPTLNVDIYGTGPVAKVHIIRNNRYVYSTEPKKTDVRFRFSDMDAVKGQTYYYYVRVEQADGNLAWASPMWITYK